VDFMMRLQGKPMNFMGKPVVFKKSPGLNGKQLMNFWINQWTSTGKPVVHSKNPMVSPQT